MSSTVPFPSDSGVMTAPPEGNVIFTIAKSGLSISNGEQVDVPITLDMQTYTTFFVHYFINADADILVHWRPTIVDGYALEKTVAVTATPTFGTGGLGGVLSGSTKSRFLSISIINTDGAMDITDVHVSIYAVG